MKINYINILEKRIFATKSGSNLYYFWA